MQGKFSKKMALAAGSVSALVAPVTADALTTVTTPISIDLFELTTVPTLVGWDIDGNGTSEVGFFASADLGLFEGSVFLSGGDIIMVRGGFCRPVRCSVDTP